MRKQFCRRALYLCKVILVEFLDSPGNDVHNCRQRKANPAERRGRKATGLNHNLRIETRQQGCLIFCAKQRSTWGLSSGRSFSFLGGTGPIQNVRGQPLGHPGCLCRCRPAGMSTGFLATGHEKNCESPADVGFKQFDNTGRGGSQCSLFCTWV